MGFREDSALGLVLKFMKNILTGLGAVWTIYNAGIRTLPITKPFLDAVYPLALAATVATIALVTGFLALPKNRVTICELANGNKLDVAFGDLSKIFQKSTGSNFLVPVNQYFDTELEDVISPRSIHGAFLTWVNTNHDTRALNRLLKKELAGFQPTPEPQKKKGKSERYAVDARVCIQISNNHYMLIPVGEMDPKTLASSMRWTDYATTIERVLKFIRETGNGRKTYIPLIGDQMLRTGLPSKALLEMMIISINRFDASDSIGSSVEIVLYEKQKNKFNLRELSHWSKSVGIS